MGCSVQRATAAAAIDARTATSAGSDGDDTSADRNGRGTGTDWSADRGSGRDHARCRAPAAHALQAAREDQLRAVRPQHRQRPCPYDGHELCAHPKRQRRIRSRERAQVHGRLLHGQLRRGGRRQLSQRSVVRRADSGGADRGDGVSTLLEEQARTHHHQRRRLRGDVHHAVEGRQAAGVRDAFHVRCAVVHADLGAAERWRAEVDTRQGRPRLLR